MHKFFKIDQTIEYVKSVVEELDNRFKYQTKINEYTDGLITKNNVLKESVDKQFRHHLL